MAVSQITRYVRPLGEVRDIMLERARHNRNPFDFTEYGTVERIFDRLTSLDRDEWARAFTEAATPHEERARAAEAAGDAAAARDQYLLAYSYYRVARYPAPNSPAKREAYARSQDMYLAAARYFDSPIERVEMPFRGRPGEGSIVVGYLQLPKGESPYPVLSTWGGIDSFKEERRGDPYLAAGMAVVSVDMPGVGDAPIPGSEDAERLWDAVFDWISTRSDLDASRVAILGGSTGGYWAAKLAYTHRERLRGAVNQGGCAHYAFTPEWIEKAQHGEYPFELAETLACSFGRETFDEWVEYAPRLSLLTQGVLDRPSAPLLSVNGIHDSVFPIADHYLLFEHGDPKFGRFFDVGHMGHTPQTLPTIVNWLKRMLGM